jgi:uncharacterized protein (TIGR02598 family)
VKLFSHAKASFSLVELTLALGVASFCLIAIFGLLPVGIRTSQDAISETASASILSAVIADLRATPETTTTSPQFGLNFGSPTTLYFDSNGRSATMTASRYRLTISFPANPTGMYAATFAHLKVSWPAPVDPATTPPADLVEAFAAFDRH